MVYMDWSGLSSLHTVSGPQLRRIFLKAPWLLYLGADTGVREETALCLGFLTTRVLKYTWVWPAVCVQNGVCVGGAWKIL